MITVWIATNSTKLNDDIEKSLKKKSNVEALKIKKITSITKVCENL